MINRIAKLVSIVGIVAFTSVAGAFTPPITFKNISPVAGTDHLQLDFEAKGQDISIIDDDGMATLASIDYHLTTKREALYEDKGSDTVENSPAENYDVVYPLLISQTNRLIKNYREWAKAAEDAESRESYDQAADAFEAFLPRLKKSPAATNAVMAEFSQLLRRLAVSHNYKGTVAGKAKKGLDISQNGGNNPVAQAHGSLGTMCEAESVINDLPALAAGAHASAAAGGNATPAEAGK